ncbi:AI-2E family transporter [Thiopseudomonas alkaliphila]|uniref:AI-2E family transporter n=1 Tax=Thiopseudomonas alkaliphila TaxID=1697053 RepID=A0AAW7DTV2_9GAMM|nr:AI-2E family transporter [Thiopseudomonas alkaliphila]MDM1696098.1 AI-2E family transporter [Thiopseudomonas alkaliphila]
MSVIKNWPWFAALALLLAFLYAVMPILTPFLVSLLIAYMGDPLVDKLEERGLSRTLGVIVVFAVIVLILAGVLAFLVPLISKQLVKLYGMLPQMVDWVQHTAVPWLHTKLGVPSDILDGDKLKQAFSEHLDKTSGAAGFLLAKVTASGMALFGFVANFVLIPVVSFYLLRDWDILVDKVRGLLPRRGEGAVVKMAKECHEVLGAFIRGQLLVMLALGGIYATGLMLLGLDLGLLVGLLAGLASIVPYMGFAVGITAALLAGVFQFGFELYPLLGIVGVFALGQALEGMVLTPLLVGDRIGLHPVAVIFAIMAGGQLFGFTGVLLALPAAAVIMVLLRHVHEMYKDSDLYTEQSAADEYDEPAQGLSVTAEGEYCLIKQETQDSTQVVNAAE